MRPANERCRYIVTSSLICWDAFTKGSLYIDGLVQDCSNSSALAMELLQFCTKPSTYGNESEHENKKPSLRLQMTYRAVLRRISVIIVALMRECFLQRHWAKTKNLGFFNSSPPGQNGCHFADNIFRCIFVNEKFCI